MSRTTNAHHAHRGPLNPAAFHILLALIEGERHGYAIMREITLQTAGRMRVGPGTLYRSIKQMLADGWIIEADERSDPALGDARRRYYRITDLGRQVATMEAERLAALVRQAYAKRLLPARDDAASGGNAP